MKKQCKYCLRWCDEKDFGVALTTEAKVYRRRKCRDCYRETKREYRNRKRQEVLKYKESQGCCKCGMTDFRALEFHHPNDDKEFNIGNSRHIGFEKLWKEIKKCEVICANCHSIQHFEEKTGCSSVAERSFWGREAEIS